MKPIIPANLDARTSGRIRDFVFFAIAITLIVLATDVIEKEMDVARNQVAGLILLALFICKDTYGGWIGKRMRDVVVVKAKSGEPASQFQCYVRNLTIFIWPLEGLALLINEERRIGDYIASTRLVMMKRDSVKSNHSLIVAFLFFALTLIAAHLTTNALSMFEFSL